MSDRLLSSSRLVLRFVSLACLGLAVAGCASGGGFAAGLLLVLSLGALTLSGCTASHGPGVDGGEPSDAAIPEDAPPVPDAGGYWERCCEDGRVSSCFCPSGWACNYGLFEDCGGGACTYPGSACPDAGVVDAGGTWEPCCRDGRIDVCFCPGGAECNYGWYTDCGDGACVDLPSECPDAADAGAAP